MAERENMFKKTILLGMIGLLSVFCYAEEKMGLEGRFGPVRPALDVVPMVVEKQTWQEGDAQVFQYEFALPKKDYQLSIQTNSEVPISVSLYGQAKPMIELNQHEFGKYSSVDFVVRTDKRDLQTQNVNLTVRVGQNNQISQKGSYELKLTPYVGFLPYIGPLAPDIPLDDGFTLN